MENELKKLSEETNINVELLQRNYDKIYNKIKKINDGLDVSELQKLAVAELVGRCRKAVFLGGRLEEFKGVILGVSGVRDFAEIRRRNAQQVWAIDKDKAIRDGLTDEGGNPLNNFGKPLEEHNYVLNIVGLASKAGIDKNPKPFMFHYSGNPSFIIDGKLKIFSAIDKSVSDDLYILRSGKGTTFVDVENEKLSDINKLMTTYLKSKIVKFSDLREWNEEHPKEDYNRFFAIQCDIMNVNPNISQKTDNWSMYIDDLEETEQETFPVLCWVPSNSQQYAIGSRVWLIGFTGKDKNTGDISINVYGLHPIDVVKIKTEKIGKLDSEIKASEEISADAIGGEEFV